MWCMLMGRRSKGRGGNTGATPNDWCMTVPCVLCSCPLCGVPPCGGKDRLHDALGYAALRATGPNITLIYTGPNITLTLPLTKFDPRIDAQQNCFNPTPNPSPGITLIYNSKYPVGRNTSPLTLQWDAHMSCDADSSLTLQWDAHMSCDADSSLTLQWDAGRMHTYHVMLTGSACTHPSGNAMQDPHVLIPLVMPC